jgi:hypothetical protein
MRLTRRTFLQQAGLALAAWGGSETGLWVLGDRYRQALASSSPRKLALLLGINQYPFSPGLEGCVTDVELQRELLIHRFGFQPTDILTLTDWQATREGIETAFVEHLIQQARTGDVVVIHFSGLGSIVSGNAVSDLRTSFVTADAVSSEEAPIVNNLLVETLWLLLRSLKTTNVTTVLDTSYAYPGYSLQGNLRIRAYPNPSMAQPVEAEIAFQAQLLHDLGISRDHLVGSGIDRLPGLVLAAAKMDQVATEIRWNHSSAGLFTNALTQMLWQATPASTIYIPLQQANHQVQSVVNQQHPQLTGQVATLKLQSSKLLPYFSTPIRPTADGVITSLDEANQQAEIWLGGLPLSLLEHYGINTLFTVLETNSEDPSTSAILQITSREGFIAKAKLYHLPTIENPPTISSLSIGQLVSETVRVLPRNIGLTVALDSSLERIERVDAISALTTVPHISSAIVGEQSADYLLSKIQFTPTQLASSSTSTLTGIAATSASSSYGLFSSGKNPIPNSTGEGGEAIKAAVKRLVPTLQSLLAAKLLLLTINTQSSKLAISIQVEQITPEKKTLEQHLINRNFSSPFSTPTNSLKQINEPLIIPSGSQIRYRLESIGSQPLYLLAIVLDSTNNLIWLIPPISEHNLKPQHNPNTTASTNTTNKSVISPSQATNIEWQIQNQTGLVETFIVLSQTPYNQTRNIITNQQQSEREPIVGSLITKPLDLIQAILQDLHQTTELSSSLNLSDTYNLDASSWLTLRFVYQII